MQIDRQTDRRTETQQTNRQIDKQTDKNTDKKTDKKDFKIIINNMIMKLSKEDERMKKLKDGRNRQWNEIDEIERD